MIIYSTTLIVIILKNLFSYDGISFKFHTSKRDVFFENFSKNHQLSTRRAKLLVTFYLVMT